MNEAYFTPPPAKPLPIKTQAKRVPLAPPTPPPAMIVLEMREEVAQTLKYLCACIGGASSGRRGHTDEISDALREAGISSGGVGQDADRSYGRTSSIYFTTTVSR